MLVSLNPSVMRYPDGTIKGYVLIARDISEIKKAVDMNTRLLEIMESAHDMIASFDMRGHIFYLNQAGHSFLGVETLDEHNNRLSQYMPIPTTVRFADGLTESQKYGFWQSEIEFISDSGEIQMTSITVVAHRTEDDRDTFFSAIVRDISDQKEIERQLVRAKVEADEANEAKSSFLARMSHEIRTPLNGIIGLTYLLQRSELTEIQEDYIRQVSDSSHNLLRILNDILDFSKLEADKLKLEQLPFRLEESLAHLSGIFSVLLGPKPVDFIIHVDPQVPAWLVGDAPRLEQVLLNLGSNAIKFTNFGTIELTITTTELTHDSVSLSITVKDTGIGMKEQQLAQLFMPFVQADEKTSRKYGGTGLGLVISQTLVELMGGKISVESSYHEGSIFRVELAFPIDHSQEYSIELVKLGLSILVLEDHDQVARHWNTILSTYGCEVLTLPSWEQAKTHLEERKWDLCVIDMEAPDMHGEETWRSWKEQLEVNGVKVISSTTLLGRDALYQLPIEYRPASVIVKPATSLQVLQALQAAMSPVADVEISSSNTRMASLVASNSFDPKPVVRPQRLLIVDDQMINRVVVKQLLEPYGFEMVLMESGAQAVKITTVEPQSIDLILMDLHMPGMDGIEATLQIRERYSSEQLPIVALTADVTEEQHARCYAAGMNDILTKPIDPDLLYAMLNKWLLVTLTPPSVTMTDVLADTWPETPGLQISSALRRLDGKSKLYLQLLNTFLLQYSDTVNRFDGFIAHGNREGAIRLMHSLSGAAGHLGAISIQEVATAMESALQGDGDWLYLRTELMTSLGEGLDSIQNLLLQKRS